MTDNKSRGFTLIELLLVIIILGILATFLMGNFFTSLKKGRDARRKEDLKQIQTALEMYYEDGQSYPATISFGSSLTNPDVTKVYIQKTPNDPLSTSGYQYNYCTEGTSPQSYQLYALLENSQDSQIITPVPLINCINTDCGNSLLCNYGVSSSNTSP